MEGTLFNKLNNEIESESSNDGKDYLNYAKNLIKVLYLLTI